MALVVLIALVPLGGYFWFALSREALERQQDLQLSAIAGDKARQISEWRSARVDDTRQTAAAVATLMDGQGGARTALVELLRNAIGSPRYEAAFVADSEGTVHTGVGGERAPEEARLAAQVVRSKQPALRDFSLGNAVRFAVAAPIFSPGATTHVEGALVMRIEPYFYFYPSLLKFPLVSDTAEVLLVRREGAQVVFLSQLRFRPAQQGIQMPLTTPGLVGAFAVTGQQGYVAGVDYRNVPVIGAFRSIPGTPWAIVAKIDRAEALGPVRELAFRSTLGSMILMLLSAVGVVLWQRQWQLAYRLRLSESEQKRLAVERHYDYLAKYANDIILLADSTGRLIEANDRAVQVYGYPREALLRLHWGDLIQPDELADFTAHWGEVAERGALLYETRQRRADGTVFPAEVSARIIEVEGGSFYQAIIRDITDRKAAESKIKRLTQLYAALSHTNAAIIRAKDREHLLKEACDIAVSEGPFGGAWIGEVDQAAGRIRRVIACGDRQGPSELPLPLPPTDPIAEALGRALTEDGVRIADDVGEEAVTRWEGVRSLAVLPLRSEGRVIGLFAVCAGERGFFDAQLCQLLSEMAADISYALDNLQREATLRESERRYRQLFNGTSSGVAVYEARGDGQDFLIKDVNPAVERVEQVRKAEILGKSIQEVFPGVRQFGLFDVLQRVWRTGQSEHLPARLYEDARHKGWRENEVYRLSTGEVVAVYDDVTDRITAAQVLQKNEQRLRLVLEGSSDGFWDWDIPGNHVYFSPRYAGILGYRQDELEPTPATWDRLIHPDDLPATRAAVEAHEKGRAERFEVEHRMRTKSGQWLWILARGKLVERDSEGKPLRMAGAISDITQRREMEEQRRLWSKVFEDSQDAILITDAARRVVAVNRAFVAVTGYQLEEVFHQSPTFLSGEHRESEYQALWRTVSERGFWQGEALGRRKDGENYPVWLSVTAVKSAGGEVVNYIGIFSDISERKEAEERIRFLSHHDLLTGLPNRALFHERAERALAASKEGAHGLALVMVDLDRFKSVNQRFGDRVGDEILRGVARRLTEVVGLDDAVGRQGGDQFAVLLPHVTTPADPARVAEAILHAVASPFPVLGEELLVTCSIGIGVAPEDGEDVESLMKNAEAALRYAKEVGRSNYEFFTPELNAKALEWLALENDLRWAMERGELFLDYQPQFDVQGSKMVGVEALVRWRHPTKGIIPPAKFIPLAEESGLVFRIGEWVLREACRQHRAWQAEGLPSIPVAVNISALQFDQKDFRRRVAQVLKETHMEPHGLELEVTETVIMKNPEEAAKILGALKEMGISIAIDDFGTGYSSLSYLQRFPIDRLKIDRSFVNNMATDPANRIVTESVIGLAKNLGLRVIAEGVETDEEVAMLRAFACDEVQGYRFSRPLSPESFTKTAVRQRWR